MGEKRGIFMATKQVSLRIGQQTLDNLHYLAFLTRKSHAQIVSDWMNILADTIRARAEQANPSLVADLHYLKNGGTIISLEE